VKNLSILLSVFLITIISGCATIVTGTDQTLTFNSEPDGATVTVSGLVIGKTPLSVQVEKGKNQSLTFEKEGYKTYSTQLSTSMNSWFWGNILIGGLLGSTTDGVSGSINEFSPDQYFVTLTPEKLSAVSAPSSRKIKELVLLFSVDIRQELASGQGGENSDALLSLLAVEEDNKATSLAALNKLSLESENDLEFAESIVDFYSIK
jgi:PEGA domain